MFSPGAKVRQKLFISFVLKSASIYDQPKFVLGLISNLFIDIFLVFERNLSTSVEPKLLNTRNIH